MTFVSQSGHLLKWGQLIPLSFFLSPDLLFKVSGREPRINIFQDLTLQKGLATYHLQTAPR